MCFGRSSTLGISFGSMPLSSTPVAVCSPCVTIIGLITNGATPITPGTFFISFMIFRYSRKSLEYFRTRTWAFTPSTLLRNSSRNPPVTLITVASAATPSDTPMMANIVPTDTKARLRDRM